MDKAWPSTWSKIADELHIFDPRGDVLLILERRSEKDIADYIDKGDSAPKREDEAHSAAEDSTIEDSTTEEPPAEEPAAEEPLSEEPPAEEPPLDWPEPDPSTEYDSNMVETKAKAELKNDPTRPRSSTSSVSSAWMMKPKIQMIQMRVSSKHLILASATFHTCLGSDKFSEGRTLQKEGNVVVLLPDEDPDAMIILLHIIHGQTRKVPRQVSLEMLSRLAFVVNHRQMHEAVELFSDSWIENLKQDPLIDRYIPEVFSWLFIFWVFQKEDGFGNMSRVLEQESDYNIEDEAVAGPPIPASIIRKIQQNRLNGIESAIQVIHDLITKYSGLEIVCSNDDRFACDAITLGSLIKSSAAIGISPRPKNPYPGVTFKTLAEKIREMQVLDHGRKDRRGYYSSSCNHGVKDSIEASMRSLEDGMCGLKLEHFLLKKTSTMRSQ